MIRELTHEIDAQRRQLAGLVGHDPLTGLPWSALAIDRLDVLLAKARRSDRKAALLFIDLDRFKAVNDSHGHSGATRCS